MGSPSAASRSLMRSKWGLVKVPTRSPLAPSRAVKARAVEVLPLVPVTWMSGRGRLGMAEHVHQPAHASEIGRRPAGVSEHALEVLMAVEPG